MNLLNEKAVLTAQDMGVSFQSAPLLIKDFIGYSIQAVFTGTPAGTFKLEVSNDSTDSLASVANWSEIDSVAISAAGSLFWNNDGAHYKWVRVAYTWTSGLGTCNARMVAKA